MGINITGILAENENLNIEKIEEYLSIKLQKTAEVSWAEAQTEQMDDNEMMLVFRNNCALLYFSFGFSRTNHSKLQKLLLASKEGVMFSCSETSMIFVFEWYEMNRKTGEDAYIFEEEYESHGENKLGLTENDDTIFNGLLPYIQNKTGLSEEDSVGYYSIMPRKPATNKTIENNIKDSDIQDIKNPANPTKKWWQFWK